MLYKQKGNFQKVVRWIGGKWMTANEATWGGIFFIFLTTFSFYFGLTNDRFRWLLCIVPAALLMRMVMNTLDGLLSREYGTATVAGELFNEALDVVGDTACYGVFLFIPDPPFLAATLLLILIWMAEFFGVLGKGFPGGMRRHETFLGGKPDRAIWISILALILFFSPGFFKYINHYLLTMSFFVLLTSVIRIRKILLAAKGKKYESYTWIGR
jgi:CDP-diacylglycerol---glycerol-3-phosphate 3-phosphatidyltransferase